MEKKEPEGYFADYKTEEDEIEYCCQLWDNLLSGEIDSCNKVVLHKCCWTITTRGNTEKGNHPKDQEMLLSTLCYMHKVKDGKSFYDALEKEDQKIAEKVENGEENNTFRNLSLNMMHDPSLEENCKPLERIPNPSKVLEFLCKREDYLKGRVQDTAKNLINTKDKLEHALKDAQDWKNKYYSLFKKTKKNRKPRAKRNQKRNTSSSDETEPVN